MKLSPKSKAILQVERAIGDLKRGMPVIIRKGTQRLLAACPETCTTEQVNALLAKGKAHLVLTSKRVSYILKSDVETAMRVPLGKKDSAKIESLCGVGDPSRISWLEKLAPLEALEQEALMLVKIGELLPAVITLPATTDSNLVSVDARAIRDYSQNQAELLIESCRTPLALTHAEKSEIVAFRTSGTTKEHYAIIIGKPGKNPLIRIHSSCYTGDLLASLSCDCRDQLHSAIELMAHKDGGIILYMLQEGRGIGLINKLRAYGLKAGGMDTVDANEALGFDDDERLFLPAAQMLKHLGIKNVKLLTNNPRKAKGLEECGIKVSSCVAHVMESNKHNEDYLKTKKERLGHRLE